MRFQTSPVCPNMKPLRRQALQDKLRGQECIAQGRCRRPQEWCGAAFIARCGSSAAHDLVSGASRDPERWNAVQAPTQSRVRSAVPPSPNQPTPPRLPHADPRPTLGQVHPWGAVQMKVGEAVAEIMKARGDRDPLRLPRQPPAGIRRRRGHPPDHRAPGAYRPAHGRRDLPRHLRQEDRRLLHAARPRQRERLWRRRPGLQRVGPAAGDPARLSAPHRRHRSELQRVTRDARRVEDLRARDRAGRDRQRPAPRLQQPAQRPQRSGDRRDPHRHLERGDRRARLHAGQPRRSPAPIRRTCARPRRRSSRRSGR